MRVIGEYHCRIGLPADSAAMDKATRECFVYKVIVDEKVNKLPMTAIPYSRWPLSNLVFQR